ncbi:hypothetical protein WICPIJ_002657 [Wickerhamomyces pijperi]|uniref:Uncharacterized protein n=1 Tax=Wickerhamomyces pijperi TaxID=599730 RepID=A0A9P8QBB3_WICPI|nr:hypothetical protein WICPIJ_002657 [Wickerhamomyces pijperi]
MVFSPPSKRIDWNATSPDCVAYGIRMRLDDTLRWSEGMAEPVPKVMVSTWSFNGICGLIVCKTTESVLMVCSFVALDLVSRDAILLSMRNVMQRALWERTKDEIMVSGTFRQINVLTKEMVNQPQVLFTFNALTPVITGNAVDVAGIRTVDNQSSLETSLFRQHHTRLNNGPIL